MAKRSAASSAHPNANKKARVDAPPAAPKSASKPVAGILKKKPPPPSSASGKSNNSSKAMNGKGKGRAVPSATFDEPAPSPNTAAASSAFSEIAKYKKLSSEPSAFEIVAGSYERILYGLHCAVSAPGGAEANVQVAMEPVFQFPAHLTCVKTAATSPNGRWLVTGAADEVIKVWDLRRRKEVGGLLGHEGDITSLTFPSDKYLVSTSADGTLCLFRTKDWSVLRRFKGHKGKVVHAAVHPQGRVALTVGKDRCLRLWDLLGRSASKGSTSTKLGAEADLVRWNSKGSKFAVLLDREIRIFSLNMDRLHTMSSRSRYHDIQFVDLEDGTELLLVACEDGKTLVYDQIASEAEAAAAGEDIPERELRCIAELVGRANRAKAISVVRALGEQLVISISSDGTIKVFPLSPLAIPSPGGAVQVQEIAPIASYDTKGSRLTCLAAVAVSGDRTTTAAASVRDENRASEEEDSADLASDQEEEGGLEPEEEDDKDEDGAEEEDDEEEEEVEGEDEWGGIDEE